MQLLISHYKFSEKFQIKFSINIYHNYKNIINDYFFITSFRLVKNFIIILINNLFSYIFI